MVSNKGCLGPSEIQTALLVKCDSRHSPFARLEHVFPRRCAVWICGESQQTCKTNELHATCLKQFSNITHTATAKTKKCCGCFLSVYKHLQDGGESQTKPVLRDRAAFHLPIVEVQVHPGMLQLLKWFSVVYMFYSVQVRLRKHKARMITLPLGRFGAPTLKPVSWQQCTLYSRFCVCHMLDTLFCFYYLLTFWLDRWPLQGHIP